MNLHTDICACGPVLDVTAPPAIAEDVFISNDDSLPIWAETQLRPGDFVIIRWTDTPTDNQIGEIISASRAGRIRILPMFSSPTLTSDVRRHMLITGIFPRYLIKWYGNRLP